MAPSPGDGGLKAAESSTFMIAAGEPEEFDVAFDSPSSLEWEIEFDASGSGELVVVHDDPSADGRWIVATATSAF